MSERLATFTTELLTRSGALLEGHGPLDVEVVAPPAVQHALEIEEHERLHFGSAPASGARRIGLDGSWLERLAKLLADHGRHRSVVLVERPRRAADPGALLEAVLDLPNATWRLVEAGPALARVLLLRFAYTATSDDRRDGLIELGVNLASRSGLGSLLPACFGAVAEQDARGDAPEPPGNLSPVDPRELRQTLERALPVAVKRALAPFLAGMRRRLERDRARLEDYHQRLLDESVAREAKARIAPEASPDHSRHAASTRETQRREAVQRDARAKLAELETKYALDVEVRPVQLLELVSPVERVTVRILRRKRSRTISLDLFPFASRLEPPPCDYRLAGDGPRLVCDEALHLVAPDGAAACPRCERPYCRACAPRACPSCGRQEGR